MTVIVEIFSNIPAITSRTGPASPTCLSSTAYSLALEKFDNNHRCQENMCKPKKIIELFEMERQITMNYKQILAYYL